MDRTTEQENQQSAVAQLTAAAVVRPFDVDTCQHLWPGLKKNREGCQSTLQQYL